MSPILAVLLFVAGAAAGSLVNWAVYRLAYRQRSISPWSAPLPEAPPRRWSDRIPIVGWLGLRREAPLHGSGFWLRPMLVELLAGAGLAWLYSWEVVGQGLLPLNLLRALGPGQIVDLHVVYVGHAALILLMAAASLIDFDEKTIPDSITVPGTLFGLILAGAYPRALLPVVRFLPGGQEVIEFLMLTSPHPWPNALTGFPEHGPLALGLGCWWLWCVGLLPRTWYSRHGWARALRLACARQVRGLLDRRFLLLSFGGSAAIAGVWLAGGLHWIGLLTALVGMAGAGGLVWAVRIIGAVTLRREAMGFGDVTLMAMFGTLLGWQTCLMVFFIAPVIALGVAVLNFLLRRQREIPYGPFLCAASVLAILRWASLWPWAASHVFILGLWVPLALVVCLAMMGVLLAIIDLVRRMLFPEPDDEQSVADVQDSSPPSEPKVQ